MIQKRRRRLGVAAVFSLIIVLARGASADPASPLPLAFPVAEPPFAAELAGIDREWNVSLKTGGKVRVVAAADLAYFGRYREVEGGPHIMLADGGLVRGGVLLVDDKQLIVGDASGLGRGLWDESALPRGAIRAVIFQPPADPLERDRLWLAIAGNDHEEDRLYLAGGETLTGKVTAAPRLGRFAPADQPQPTESFTLVRRGGAQPLTVPAGRVVAVRFQSPVRDAPRGGVHKAWLGLDDGSLLGVSALSIRGDTVLLALAAGGELRMAAAGRDEAPRRFVDAVTYLEPATPRVAWLSDRPQLGYRHIPFLSVQRDLGIDQSVLGTRLRTGGALARKGLGMPTASRLAFDTAGYRKFAAEVAVDEAAGLRGSVVFKLAVERASGQWEVAYQSPVLRGGDVPLPVSLDLAGASRMALLVDFADRGDECDVADWLMARLTK